MGRGKQPPHSDSLWPPKKRGLFFPFHSPDSVCTNLCIARDISNFSLFQFASGSKNRHPKWQHGQWNPTKHHRLVLQREAAGQVEIQAAGEAGGHGVGHWPLGVHDVPHPGRVEGGRKPRVRPTRGWSKRAARVESPGTSLGIPPKCDTAESFPWCFQATAPNRKLNRAKKQKQAT